MEKSLLHLLAYSAQAGAPDGWLVVTCALAVGAVLAVLAVGLAQHYHERGNHNVIATQLTFDLVAPAPAAMVVDVAPAVHQVAAPAAAQAPARHTYKASRCPLCSGHLVDSVCEKCGMEISL